MAFFDKLNDLAKEVTYKANDALELTKLNSKINSEKTAIGELMRQIGEYYYSVYTAGTPADPAIAQQLSEIDSHNLAIADAQAQIAALKAENESAAKPAVGAESIICPSCGKNNPIGTRFCGGCGAKLEIPAVPQKKTCPSCAAEIETGTKFCSECGARLE